MNIEKLRMLFTLLSSAQTFCIVAGTVKLLFCKF